MERGEGMDRRRFIKQLGAGVFLGVFSGVCRSTAASRTDRPNVMLITADDMNWDAPGVYGCSIRDITPNIDRLAREGMRFIQAHITIAVCQPSRQCLMTGRYPHRNGAEGFEPIDVTVPTLQESLRQAGYRNGILGKTTHLAPAAKFCWDYVRTFQELGKGRDPQRYYAFTREFLTQARSQGRPFFLMANSHDPHRPFAGSDQEKARWKDDVPAVRRRIRPEDVGVPGFLPDLPEVRREVAEYYTSVHRCDETVGAVLRALDESGMAGQTLVVFLSDNGMAFPFAKTNVYLNSTRTPWIARWPGRIAPGSVDDRHLISGVDYMPTILEACGLAAVPGMDGTSFIPVLLGKRQSQRRYVFTEFHQTSARRRYPMRCVQDGRYAYIVNFWADGRTVFRNESQSGRTFRAMQTAAATDVEVAERVKLFLYRVREEFYDLQRDPDALHNRIDDAALAEPRRRLQQALQEHMKQTQDPALEAFIGRDDAETVARFMAEQNARAQRNRRRDKGK